VTANSGTGSSEQDDNKRLM